MSSCVPGRAAGAPCGKSRPCPPRSGCLQSRRRCFSPVPMQAHLRRVKGESPLLSRGGKTGAAPLHSHSLSYRGPSAQRPWFLPRRIHSSGGKTCSSGAAAAGRCRSVKALSGGRGNIPEPAEERRRGSPASRRIPASGQKGGCNRGNRLFRQSPCVCRIAGPLRPGHGSAYKPALRPARRHPLAARNRLCGAVPARLPGRSRRAGLRPVRLRPKRPAVPFHAVAPGHGEPAAFQKGAMPSRQSCVAPASAGPCRRGCPRPLAPGISWR